MSSRTLALIAFLVYSLICWRWYVCGIKQQCGNPVQATASPVTESPAIEPDTSATEPAFTPVNPSDSNTGTTTPPATDEPDIEKVQVEELSDHVLIHFPYNSTRKEENAAIDDYLTRLAEQLRSSGGTVALIGHTDNVGDSKTNVEFALRRAKNIRDILIKKGVDRKQITTKSFGESKPLATNDNPRGRYKNRRVEIRVKP